MRKFFSCFFKVSGLDDGQPDFFSYEDHFNALEYDPNILSSWFNEETGWAYATRIDFLGIFPSASSLPENTPNEIRLNLKEAKNCLAINASTAASIMIRRVLEFIYLHIDPNPKDLKLYPKLKRLLNADFIDQQTFDMFNEIREWGNMGAHDLSKRINFNDIHLLVNMIEGLVTKIFDDENKLEKLRLQLRSARGAEDDK